MLNIYFFVLTNMQKYFYSMNIDLRYIMLIIIKGQLFTKKERPYIYKDIFFSKHIASCF